MAFTSASRVRALAFLRSALSLLKVLKASSIGEKSGD
jgi:hypothetical protein